MKESKSNINDIVNVKDNASVELLKVTLNNLKDITDVNMSIGTPIYIDKYIIIPLSLVKYGFISAGLESSSGIKDFNEYPFSGGSGAISKVTPIGIILINDGEIKLLQIDKTDSTLEVLLNTIPQMFSKIYNTITK